MPEPFDEYIDQITMNINAYGIALNFRKTSAAPIMPGTAPAAIEIGTVRMSLEHFKVMAFMLKRQINEVESQLGISIPIPPQVLNSMRIAPEDWENFWKRI
jgi:hypothetical protein